MKRFAIACVSILLLVMIMAGFGVQRSKTRLRLEMSGNNIAQAPIRTRRLTTDEWYKFIKLLRQASYWQLSTESKNGGKDGAQWILEGKKDKQYHLVDRWTPRRGSYSEACLYLLKLSGQKRQEIY